MSKTVFGMMLAFLLVGVLIVTFNIHPVMSSGTIYIRADGSIDPTTANITTVDNVTYTFTGNNYDEIVVERNNIIIDGAGYTLQGLETPWWYRSRGISLSGKNNVTIKHLEIRLFDYGLVLNSSSNHNSLYGNNVTANIISICVISSSNNNIVNNTIFNLVLDNSSNNYIFGNNVIADRISIWLIYSSNNHVMDNIADGIWLVSSSKNNIVNNTGSGILIMMNSNYNNILENTGSIAIGYKDNYEEWEGSDFNSIVENNCSSIYFFSAYSNRIVRNTVTVDHGSTRYSTGIYLENSEGNSIIGNSVTANNGTGIHLTHSFSIEVSQIGIPRNGNRIIGNNITANYGTGIHLEYSGNNSIIGNIITANNGTGISFYRAGHNTFHHNNFMDNAEEVNSITSINVWDNGLEGNYWSNYNGTDSDGDGIGDSPYIINEDNQDNYPLMKPQSPLFGDINYDFMIDMKDIGIAAWSIGTYPTHQRWNVEADANQDGRVDMKDLISVAKHFGETDP